MTPNQRLVNESLAYAEKLYGKPPAPATFDVQEVRDALHADWDALKNHVTIRIPTNMSDADRKGQLAHESFHIFSPVTLAEATYLDEGLATLLAVEHRQYSPFPDQTKYYEALELVRRLIATCPDSVRNLLSARKRIALVSEQDISAVCKDFPASEAKLLVRKFYH